LSGAGNTSADLNLSEVTTLKWFKNEIVSEVVFTPKVFIHAIIPGNMTQLFTAPVDYLPPSEKGSNGLSVEIQEGCPWGQCTYCKTWQGQKFRNKDEKEVLQGLEATAEVLSREFAFNGDSSRLSKIRRVYLAGADVLAYPHEELMHLIGKIRGMFEPEIGFPLSRISGYVSAMSILRTPAEQLSELCEAGFNVAYWGLDSGSTEVLRLVNKPYTKEGALEAAEKLAQSGIRPSINVMPGLGGIRHYSAHVTDTIDVLTRARPRWVTMLSVDPTERYAQTIVGDGNNSHLTEDELANQMLEMLIGLQLSALGENHFKCEIAAHGTDKTPIAQNPVTFKVELGDIETMEWYARRIGLESQIRATPEWVQHENEIKDRDSKMMRDIGVPVTVGVAGCLLFLKMLFDILGK
jgi:hypothetical protein